MADTTFEEIMTVELVPHDVRVPRQSIVGPTEEVISYDQYQVFVKSALIDGRESRIHVGYIGKQKGANFCHVNALKIYFFGEQRKWIAEKAKELHGHASPEPWIDPQ